MDGIPGQKCQTFVKGTNLSFRLSSTQSDTLVLVDKTGKNTVNYRIPSEYYAALQTAQTPEKFMETLQLAANMNDWKKVSEIIPSLSNKLSQENKPISTLSITEKFKKFLPKMEVNERANDNTLLLFDNQDQACRIKGVDYHKLANANDRDSFISTVRGIASTYKWKDITNQIEAISSTCSIQEASPSVSSRPSRSIPPVVQPLASLSPDKRVTATESSHSPKIAKTAKTTAPYKEMSLQGSETARTLSEKKGILFDFDQTLVSDHLDRIFAQPKDEILSKALGGDAALSRFAAMKVDARNQYLNQHPEVLNKFFDSYLANPENTARMEAAGNLIRTLHEQGKTIGIASHGRFGPVVETYLERMGVYHKDGSGMIQKDHILLTPELSKTPQVQLPEHCQNVNLVQQPDKLSKTFHAQLFADKMGGEKSDIVLVDDSPIRGASEAEKRDVTLVKLQVDTPKEKKQATADFSQLTKDVAELGKSQSRASQGVASQGGRSM